jgi:hypothetical protein
MRAFGEFDVVRIMAYAPGDTFPTLAAFDLARRRKIATGILLTINV